jgi:hypothetical protein
MSEVLEDFVEPFRDLVGTETLEDFRKLITMGAAAWNLSLLPEVERGEMLDSLVTRALAESSDEDPEAFRAIIETLVIRKLTFFANNRRPILNFTVEDRGNDFYLLVASGVEDLP